MPAGARVLVVDDEYSVRRLLRLYLEREGYAVVEANNGPDALSLLRRNGIDLALIDVMLPGFDGFELVRRIRRESDIPLILLTARGEEVKRVTGLEIGADDYVVKPFSAAEVMARVGAHLRRSAGHPSSSSQASPLTVGRLSLDPKARRVSVEGQEVELTRREFDLLESLLASSGRVLTRDELLDRVWGSRYVSSKTVDVHVAALRRKLGSALEITTLRGIGYRVEHDA
jgi:DNA-binding response OmpR family regulator